MNTKDDLALLKLNETLIDYCHVKNRDCLTCSFKNALKLDEECPIDQAIELINKIRSNAEVIEMSEETEQEIAKRIHAISTQIENIKATQLNTEQLTAVIRSANAQVRHIERQKDEVSQDEFQQACEMVKDTAEKLDYWESRYKLVLDIIEEWDKDFIQLKADYEMLTEADGKTNKDAEYWKQKCIDINNDYIQLNKALKESNQKLLDLRGEHTDLQTKYDELTDESKVNAATSEFHRQESNRHAEELMHTHDECNAKQRTIKQLSAELGKTREICEQRARKVRDLESALADTNRSKKYWEDLNNANEREFYKCKAERDKLKTELNTKNADLERAEYNYKAVSLNLEKVNAECEAWKQRYKEFNKKFDNNAVKFTDAKLKADAIAMSYDELSETLHTVEQERDQYKEKYEVTKKLLDAETSAEHTGSDSYNELYKENQQLYAALDKKEEQIDGLFKEAKLLTETKVSLVNELLDLKYLIHKLRLDDETPENDETIS